MLRQAFSRLAALAAVVMVTVSLAGCGVNNIPTYEQNAKAKWSEVLSQYKRRTDLVPNLVETVKGYAAHEKGTAHEWTADEARSAGRKGGQVSRGGRGRLVDTVPGATVAPDVMPLPAAPGFEGQS